MGTGSRWLDGKIERHPVVATALAQHMMGSIAENANYAKYVATALTQHMIGSIAENANYAKRIFCDKSTPSTDEQTKPSLKRHACILLGLIYIYIYTFI